MTINDGDAPGERLRQAPVDRFAGTAHAFDLVELLTRLRTEDHPSRDGHRQISFFHRAPITHLLFSFEPGGKLARHSARGEVTIQVIEGRLLVEAEERDHDLASGHVLILSPGVLHDVRAQERSAMLLTVHMIA